MRWELVCAFGVLAVPMAAWTVSLGLDGDAGIGRNQLAIVLGVLGLAIMVWVFGALLLCRATRVRGFANEIRIYHLYPSRSRPMVQRLSGHPSEFVMRVRPDLGDARRPTFPAPNLGGFWPKLPEFDWITISFKGLDEEAHLYVAAQWLRWDFQERFAHWRDDPRSPATSDHAECPQHQTRTPTDQ